MNWLRKALSVVGRKGEEAPALQILLVDDTPANLQVLMHTLKGLGHKLVAANSGARALELSRKSLPSLVLLDVMMPGMDGFEVCERFKSDPLLRDVPIVFCSALDDTASKVRGFDLGAADFITKPFQPAEVVARVTTQLALSQLLSGLDKRNSELERELALAQEYREEAMERLAAPLLGSGPAITTLRGQVHSHARSTTPLLIRSKISCGSEGVARAIHGESSRKTGPFVIVDCAKPRGLEMSRIFRRLEDDLASQVTKISLAEGGTLFLDSINRLPGPLQEDLVQLLVERQNDQRQGHRLRHDVRIIATVIESENGTCFPEDFDQRLVQVLQENLLTLPSLTDRKEDIPELTRHFVKRHSARIGHPIVDIPEETMDRLRQYDWPGNLRELDDVIRRSIIQSQGSSLFIEEQLLTAGIPLGSYRLIHKLGQGGMGEVWQATHQLLSRPAAVKLIKADIEERDGDNLRFQRFEREARITANLTSRNTVELYDFGVSEEGSFYYVMELLEGIDLHDAIDLFGPMRPGRVAQLLAQCCSSLSEAHLAGLVHRDIKPANLYICRLGLEVDILKVLDFGLVTDHVDSEGPRLTQHDSFCGTPAFMSPEAAMSSTNLDGRSDVYALGCVAYWLLTGTQVFDAPNSMGLMMKHISEEPELPSTRCIQPIPPALEEIVMRCLSKKVEDRPTAEELWQQLLDTELHRDFSLQEAYEWWAIHLEGDGAVPLSQTELAEKRDSLLVSKLPR